MLVVIPQNGLQKKWVVIIKMKKILKFIFVDYFETLYLLSFLYGVFKDNTVMMIVSGACMLLTYMASIKTEIRTITNKLKEMPRGIYTIEKSGGIFIVNERKYTDRMFTEQFIYGVFRLKNHAERYCHLLNTGRWDEYIGAKVHVMSNAGCYANYTEFFEINECVASVQDLSTYDIPTDEEYYVADVGFDSNGNKILVLRASFRSRVYLYRYADLKNGVSDNGLYKNIYETF